MTGKSLRSLGAGSKAALSYAGSRRSSKYEEDSDGYWDELDADFLQTLIDAEMNEYKGIKHKWNRITDKFDAGKMLRDDMQKEIEPLEQSLTRLKKRITFL